MAISCMNWPSVPLADARGSETHRGKKTTCWRFFLRKLPQFGSHPKGRLKPEQRIIAPGFFEKTRTTHNPSS
jgi:hypothetical protein